MIENTTPSLTVGLLSRFVAVFFAKAGVGSKINYHSIVSFKLEWLKRHKN